MQLWLLHLIFGDPLLPYHCGHHKCMFPRLGEIARGSLDIGGGEWATLMNALDMGGGGSTERSAYGNMTRSFERVARGMDDSGACQRKCNRCIAL